MCPPVSMVLRVLAWARVRIPDNGCWKIMDIGPLCDASVRSHDGRPFAQMAIRLRKNNVCYMTYFTHLIVCYTDNLSPLISTS